MADEYMKYKLSSRPHCEEGAKLGQGGFGVVFKTNVRRPGLFSYDLCAVKRISNQNTNLSLSSTKSQRELIVCIKLLQHEWFLQFFGWYQDEHYFYLAMEYIELGDLDQHISFKWSEEDTKVVASQLLQGLSIMHEHQIIHRDMKPANVFPILLDSTQCPVLRIKIGDFGISKPTSNNNTTMTSTGTLEYMAPETIEGSYNTSVDIWALGCIFFRMITGKVPFLPGHAYLYKHGLKEFPFKELEDMHMTTAGIEFLQKIMQVEPEDRMTAQEALNSDWILSKPSGFQITGQLTQYFVNLQGQYNSEGEQKVRQVTKEKHDKEIGNKTKSIEAFRRIIRPFRDDRPDRPPLDDSDPFP